MTGSLTALIPGGEDYKFVHSPNGAQEYVIDPRSPLGASRSAPAPRTRQYIENALHMVSVSYTHLTLPTKRIV